MEDKKEAIHALDDLQFREFTVAQFQEGREERGSLSGKHQKININFGIKLIINYGINYGFNYAINYAIN